METEPQPIAVGDREPLPWLDGLADPGIWAAPTVFSLVGPRTVTAGSPGG